MGSSSVTDAFTLNVTGGTVDGTVSAFLINDDDADWTSATINSTGAANTLGTVNISGFASKRSTYTATDLTIAASSDLTILGLTGFAADATVTITGAGKFDFGKGLMQSNIDTIDASGNSGGVHVQLDVETDTKFTGGSGNDKVTVAYVTYVATSTAAINAGAGTDTLALTSRWPLSTAASGAKFTNFEILEVRVPNAIDLDNISGIESLILDDAQLGKMTNVSATQAGDVTVQQSQVGNSVDIGIKGATTGGQIDTPKSPLMMARPLHAINFGNLTSTGTENLELTAKDNIGILSLTNIKDVTSIKVSGAGTTFIQTDALAVVNNTKIDASAATGAFSLDASDATGNALAVTGGSGNDAISMAATDLGDVIVGGAGNDTITANGQSAEVTTITYATDSDNQSTYTIAIAGQSVVVLVRSSDKVARIVHDTVKELQKNATLVAAGYEFSAAGGVVTVTAPNSAGDIANITVTEDAAQPTATTATVNVTTVGGEIAANVASDTITGGAGNDTFNLSAGGAVTVADIITDLNLGGNGSGNVDTIVFGDIGAATTEAVVTLTGTQQQAVSNAGNLGAAVDAVFAAAGTDGNVVQFTYGSDTYIAVNGDDNDYDAGADLLVKVTGVTGTLDVGDFTFAA